MSGNVWIEMESAIRDQLALQVELAFNRHHGFMLDCGLARCRDVVDIGTGNGLFLGKVAEAHPEIRFHGIDSKPQMVQESESRGLSNVEWMQADALDPRVQVTLGGTDGILMRYFLLHMPSTSAALGVMLSRVRPGTRLWVFDLDTDYCRCEPPHAAHDWLRNLVQEFCDRNSVEIRTGRMLPPILDALGFEVDEVAVEPFNNKEINPTSFAEYMLREATLYHHSLFNNHDSDELRALKQFLYEVMEPKGHFVQYGMVMISAVKRSSR